MLWRRTTCKKEVSQREQYGKSSKVWGVLSILSIEHLRVELLVGSDSIGRGLFSQVINNAASRMSLPFNEPATA